MSIETQIQDLIVALNNNTAALLAVNGSAVKATTSAPKVADKEVETPAPTKKTRGAKVKAPEPETPPAPEYTLEEVREMSSSLLEAEAISKDVLKAKITELGFNKMVDMDDDGLAALYEFMLEIYNDAQTTDADADEDL